jgi:hypothetical protein
VCGEVFLTGSMKSSLLLRHLQTKHTNYENKDRSFFERLLKPHDIASYLSSTKKDNENSVEGSYRISYQGMGEKISQYLNGLKSFFEKYFPKPGRKQVDCKSL